MSAKSIRPSPVEMFMSKYSTNSKLGSLSSERRDYAFRKDLLRLDRFPVFQPAEIRNDGQLANSALVLQVPHLANHFFGCADKADFLLHDLFVGQLRQRFQRPARIEAIALGAQLGFNRFALQRVHWRGVVGEKIVKGALYFFSDLLLVVI